MAVYTDGIHLIADTIPELHSFARKIQLNKCWCHKPKKGKDPDKIHYDLGSGKGVIGESFRKEMVERAINAGAIIKSSKELIIIINQNKNK